MTQNTRRKPGARLQEVKTLREAGMCCAEIAQVLGMDRKNLKAAAKKIGMPFTEEEIERSIKIGRERAAATRKTVRRGAEARQLAVSIIANGGSYEDAASATGYSPNYCRQLAAKEGYRKPRIYKTKKPKLIELLQAGKDVKEAAQEVGCSISYSKSVAYKLGLVREQKEEECEAARLYKAKGHTYQEVADKFGRSKTWAQKYCKGIAPQQRRPQKYCNGYTKDVQSNDELAIRMLSRHNTDWEYVDGYEGSEGRINARHKECGQIQSLSMVTVRHDHCRCNYCYQQSIEKEREAKRLEAEAEAYRKELTHQANRYKGKQIELKVCQHCGAVFADSKRKYCSDECTRAVTNKRHSVKKDRRRLAAFTIESKQITIPALYERDNGRCWLCGELCDLTADTNDNSYPSIDHVLPISKGGKDEWSNVRLAHRWCNSKRGNANIFMDWPIQYAPYASTAV